MDSDYATNLITCPFCATICIKMVFLADGTGGHERCITTFLSTDNPKSMITNLPLSHKSWSPSKSHDGLITYYIKNTNIFDKYLPDVVHNESIDTIYMLYECNKLSTIDPSILDTKLIELIDGKTSTFTKILTIIDNYITDANRRNTLINNIFVLIIESYNENQIINFLTKHNDILNKYDFDNDGSTLLIIACKNNMKQLFSFLMSNIKDQNILAHANKTGNTALILACNNKMEDEAMKILEFENVGINYINMDGLSALNVACIKKLPSVAAKILDRSDILLNNLSIHDQNPLNISCNSELEDISIKILNHPNATFDINNISTYGNTTLIIACVKKMETLCLKILDHPNIQINHTNNVGINALNAAINSKLEKVCLKILDHPGIRVNYINSENLSAYDMAKKANLINVVKRIKHIKKLYTKKRKFGALGIDRGWRIKDS